MPFKGDMRLGGPHDNEANLNGSSDMDGAPSAGTIIGTLNDTAYILGPVVGYYYYTLGGNEYVYGETYTQRCTVNIIADGIGGQSYDYTTATNIEYYPYGTIIHANNYETSSYLDLNGNQYVNGTIPVSIGHNGGGYLMDFNGTPSYNQNGSIFLTETVEYTSYFADTGENYPVGNYELNYVHDNNGGYTTWSGPQINFPINTVVGSQSGTSYVYIGMDQYVNGDYYNPIVTNGSGALEWGQSGGYSNYTPAYYLIFIDQNNNDHYYHDGVGYYTVSYGGPAPTGNSQTFDNNIEINGNYYPNGTYTATEYHDGQGGFTYANSVYSYASYGHTFFSDSYYDEWGNWTGSVSYKSDNNGGYYTE